MLFFPLIFLGKYKLWVMGYMERVKYFFPAKGLIHLYQGVLLG